MVFDYFLDMRTMAFTPWADIVPQFTFDGGTPYFQLLVPTVDTVCPVADADVAGESPVLMQMWHGVSPVLMQMWQG